MPMNTKKTLRLAKGFRGRSKNCIRIARQRVEKSLQYAYRDRRRKKREFRKMWIQQISAATTQHGISYSRFVYAMAGLNIALDRKALATLAQTEPYSFRSLTKLAEDYLAEHVHERVSEKRAVARRRFEDNIVYLEEGEQPPQDAEDAFPEIFKRE